MSITQHTKRCNLLKERNLISHICLFQAKQLHWQLWLAAKQTYQDLHTVRVLKSRKKRKKNKNRNWFISLFFFQLGFLKETIFHEGEQKFFSFTVAGNEASFVISTKSSFPLETLQVHSKSWTAFQVSAGSAGSCKNNFDLFRHAFLKSSFLVFLSLCFSWSKCSRNFSNIGKKWNCTLFSWHLWIGFRFG